MVQMLFNWAKNGTSHVMDVRLILQMEIVVFIRNQLQVQTEILCKLPQTGHHIMHVYSVCWCVSLPLGWQNFYIDGLVQERRNSIANALELRLPCTNVSIWWILKQYTMNSLRPGYATTCQLSMLSLVQAVAWCRAGVKPLLIPTLDLFSSEANFKLLISSVELGIKHIFQQNVKFSPA